MTKIITVHARQKEYEKIMVEIERIEHEDNGEALESHREAFRDFLTADRTALLTELREWSEEEPTINGMMLKARLLARIDELINPPSV